MSNKEKDTRDGLFGSLSIAIGGTLIFLMLNSKAEFYLYILVFVGFFLMAFGIALMFDKI